MLRVPMIFDGRFRFLLCQDRISLAIYECTNQPIETLMDAAVSPEPT